MTLERDDDYLNAAQKSVDKACRSNRFELVRVGDLPFNPPRWLIRNMLEEDTLAMLFGDPGAGKTFVALSMACCIATGTDWYGREVNKGMVVYIAGEGHGGIARRLKAWSLKHGVDLSGAPLRISNGPVALSDPRSLQDVSDAISKAQTEEGESPRLVIIDTLARNFGTGDENSTQDMQDFIAVLDELRSRHGCTILLVHHSGHSDKSRARGAMALKGAVDAEYRVAVVNEDEVINLEATKMKDGPCPPKMELKIASVKLPLVDEYDKTATSAVLVNLPQKLSGRRSED